MFDWLRRWLRKPLRAHRPPSSVPAQDTGEGGPTKVSIGLPVPEIAEPPLTAKATAAWLTAMPARVLALDVETTGLDTTDRVVSAGFLLLETCSLVSGQIEMKINHLIFNPERRSHPAAERIHGYRQSVLVRQETFSEEMDSIRELLDTSNLVVAHNADFDVSFLDRELAAVGYPPISKPRYCTMNEWRNRGLPGPASLDAIAKYLGMARSSHLHNALEDAWLALRIYLLLCGCPVTFGFEAVAAAAASPLNLRAAACDEIWASETHLADVMASAKRSGNFDEAERFLADRIARTETMARLLRTAVPYSAYGILASICRRQKRYFAEAEILTRYCTVQQELGHEPSGTAQHRLDRVRALAARVTE
jgi:DNA polymerase III subunit epsilon